MVDGHPFALLIRAVSAPHLAGRDKALVDGQAVGIQAGENILRAACHLPLFVGVLQAEIEHPVGGAGGQPVDHGGEKHAEMQIPGGAGSNAGDPGTLLQRAGRIHGLVILRRVGDGGKHGRGQTFQCRHVDGPFTGMYSFLLYNF